MTPTSTRHRQHRRASLALVLLLLAQAFLGMITNLYLTLPASHPGAHSASYFAGILPGIGWAILHAAPELALHATLGILLALASLITLLITARSRRRVDIALATLGAATIIGAGFNGASFLNYGHNLSSLIMTGCALLAIASYSTILYLPTMQAQKTGTQSDQRRQR